MAGSERESMMDVLRAFITDQDDLRDIADKLVSNKMSVLTLLSMSKSELKDLLSEIAPAALLGVRFGVQAAIQNQNELKRRRDHLHEGALHNLTGVSAGSSGTHPVNLASHCFSAQLLELPKELPRSPEALQNFLSHTPVMLPICDKICFLRTDVVAWTDSKETYPLATICELAVAHMIQDRGNEATSSSVLNRITGDFLIELNILAPPNRQLKGLDALLDASNRSASDPSSQPIEGLLRPDFQLFVKDCLMLRWENKFESQDWKVALHENMSKLQAWSHVYYGKLPNVIGGCCAGRQFRWLQLYPTGDGGKIDYAFISPVYDLRLQTDVVRFLHTMVRMHCLLQKLQEELGDNTCLRMYETRIRDYGGRVLFYPHRVKKEIPKLDSQRFQMIESMYGLITKSRYLVQKESMLNIRGKTILVLHPVGDPMSKPVDWKDLENTTHDMLHGLADLHQAGFTHRGLIWVNCVKVNDAAQSKWVIIDLEDAGRDKEEWGRGPLRDWDEKTLEEGPGKNKVKVYSTGSDIYQFGKLISEWMALNSVGNKDEREGMASRPAKMQLERVPAANMIQDICGEACKRCRLLA